MNVRKYIPAIVLLCLAVIMSITNPGEEHYKLHMKNLLLQQKFTESDLDNKLIINKTYNYFIFSGYTFQITDAGVTIQGKYLGVFGNFYSLGGYTPDESQ